MIQPLLEVDRVSFSVPGRALPILDEVNFTLRERDFLILLGGNGSGKSSLLKIINQYYQHTAGTVTYAKPLMKHNILTITQKPADSLFMELTVLENAILLESRSGKKMRTRKLFVQELRNDLSTFNGRLADALQTPICQLSGGEQQILMLALCMRQQPKLLLLDEHTSALDPKTAEKVMQFTDTLIKRERMTCIMTSHHLDFSLRFGNRLLAMNQGQVVYQADAAQKATITRDDLLRCCY
jgi:putative tryptophan/tyrosine transport system ATP-binding protein